MIFDKFRKIPEPAPSGTGLAFGQLSSLEKKTYLAIDQAVRSGVFQTEWFSGGGKVPDVLARWVGDHPEVFYLDSQVVISKDSFGRQSLKLRLLYPKHELSQRKNQLEEALEQGVSYVLEGGAVTDYDKLLGICEYLQEQVSYHQGELEAFRPLGGSKYPSAHTAYGALVEKKAVCDGISLAFGAMAQRLGIQNTMIRGEARWGKRWMGHGWNLVELGGECYHIDATWDLCSYKQVGSFVYHHLLLCDQDIQVDHRFKGGLYPPCKVKNKSYHHRKGSYLHTEEELRELLRVTLQKKRKQLSFRKAPTMHFSQKPADFIQSCVNDFGVHCHYEIHEMETQYCYILRFQYL